MSLQNCPRCGNTFSPERSMHHICPDCLSNENKDLKIVMAYLNKSPLASVMEVCAKTGVPASSVKRFIESGTLKLA